MNFTGLFAHSLFLNTFHSKKYISLADPQIALVP